MPLLELTLPEGAIAPDKLDVLADQLTGTLLRAEGAPDDEFFRSISWLDVHWIPRANAYRGGVPAEKPRYRVAATTPEGALTDERKAQFVEEATKLVLEAAGEDPADPDAGLRTWVLCHEVKDGGWGGAGRVFRRSDLAAIAKQRRADRDTAGAPA